VGNILLFYELFWSQPKFYNVALLETCLEVQKIRSNSTLSIWIGQKPLVNFVLTTMNVNQVYALWLVCVNSLGILPGLNDTQVITTRLSWYQSVFIKIIKVYKGCYVDSGIRDLPIELGQPGTIDACLTACAGQSERYFGVQAGLVVCIFRRMSRVCLVIFFL